MYVYMGSRPGYAPETFHNVQSLDRCTQEYAETLDCKSFQI